MKILVLFIALFFTTFALSDDHNHNQHKDHKNHSHEDANLSYKQVNKSTVSVKVKGMVCAFCAQGIERNFGKLKEVKSTKVDLDKMIVTIHLKPNQQLSEEKIKEVIVGAGFSYEGKVK